MNSSKHNKNTYKTQGRGPRLLYDARGERVKESILNKKIVRVLLFIILPYIVINGLIFILVCSTPKVEIKVGDTSDYVSADVDFTVKSILPIKELEVTMESTNLDYTKDGSNYSCKATSNGTIQVRAKAVNGMTKMEFADVGILDDMAPSVDEQSASISQGILSFALSDTQSGVDFDSVYGVLDNGDRVEPETIDRELGMVSLKLPNDSEYVDLYFSDMVGNSRQGRITITTSGLMTDQEEEQEQDLNQEQDEDQTETDA